LGVVGKTPCGDGISLCNIGKTICDVGCRLGVIGKTSRCSGRRICCS